MSRILTGIQATGTPHLGNLLGAIIPAIELSKKDENDSFLFIANLHTLTQIKDAEELRTHTYEIAAAWLAFGLDTQKTHFYRQSDIPEVCELMWYLDCFFPYQRLTLAHSFKDKADRLQDVNAGLFNYPILMAADILLYDAEIVPVGKDQLQHLEITRDLAEKFNRQMGETFVLPSAELQAETKYVPGTDGQKMSKSTGNTILPMELITGDNSFFEKGFSPSVIRFFFLQAHYRSVVDLSNNALLASEKGFNRLMEAVKIINDFETENTEVNSK